MGLTDFLFGSESEVEQRSVLSGDQQNLLKQLINMMSFGLTKGATPSQYAAYATTPSLLSKAFGTGASLFGTGTDTITAALTAQAAGKPAYTFNPGATTKRFETTFAQPMMESWRTNVLPVVRESFNLPGVSGSSMMARGVTDAANRFYGESVQPQLFNALQNDWMAGITSQENAAGRQIAGATALGQLPMLATSGALQLGGLELSEQERILAALKGEESRLMGENNPYFSMAGNLSTSQTIENIGLQGSSGQFGNLLSAGLGATALGGFGIKASDLLKFFG